MRRALSLATLALALASPAQASHAVAYTCSDGAAATAVYLDGAPAAVHVTTAAGSATLSQVRAASGARYEAEGWLWWTKGDEAQLETPAGRDTTCEAVANAD